jgi:hypothetical protein
VQEEKQELEIVSIDAGREINRSDEHFANADSSRIRTLLPASNRRFERLRQPQKQELEIVSIEEGMQIE